MNTNLFRVATAITSLVMVLFASAVMPASQAGGMFLIDDPIGSYESTSSATSGPAVARTPGRIRFSFSGYANPQRPFPGYQGEWQLGPVSIQGSGEISSSDGALLSGGQISHTDNLRDRRYPYHSTTWQVVKALNIQSAGGRTDLWLQVQVTSSNYRTICPVGTFGVIQVVDDNRRMRNGYAADAIVTWMPNPPSTAPDGYPACRTHVHGFNNVDYSYTDPQRGGANGGIWAIVEISAASEQGAFTGSWYSKEWGTLTFQQNGSQVTGRYNNGNNLGVFKGSVSGNRIRVFWNNHSGMINGEAYFVLRSDGSLEGKYCFNQGCDPERGTYFVATRK